MSKRAGVALRGQKEKGVVRAEQGPGQYMVWKIGVGDCSVIDCVSRCGTTKSVLYLCAFWGLPLSIDPPDANDDAADRAIFTALLGSEDEFERCCIEAKVDEPGEFGLSRSERLAVWIYSSTDDHWYARINSELRAGAPSLAVTQFANILNQALAKLPAYSGEVYRGMTIPDVDDIADEYEIGRVIEWAAFTSSTKNPRRVFEGNVIFIILSVNGRSLGVYADKPSEEEILFSTRMRIEVLGTERRGHLLVINVAEMTR